MSLRDILSGRHAAAHEAFMHADMMHDEGGISLEQLRRLSDATNEAWQALRAHDADHSSYAGVHHPAAASATYATVNGVLTDTSSPEYARWYAEHYGSASSAEWD